MCPESLNVRSFEENCPTSSHVARIWQTSGDGFMRGRIRGVSVHLEHRDPETNCFRFYHLDLQPSLFGGWSLVRRWGRIGTWGRQAISLFETWDAAESERSRFVKVKSRRGYVEDRA